ncbi:hypothetical protein [Halovivax sp.]|uniref:hypothetical protein n=1 Tax=Halovivax sp. TaxID=1935978 RepID=UPI0025BBF61B|nr:hypothetical protein [Halovivax sp.]
MPTCPGCKTHLSHHECVVHVRYCKWVWSEHPEAESHMVDHLVNLVDEDRRRERES